MAKESKPPATASKVVTPTAADKEIEALKKRLNGDAPAVLEIDTAKQMARESGLTVRAKMLMPGEDRAVPTTVMPVFECTAKEVRAMVANRPDEPEAKVLARAVERLPDGHTVCIAKEHAMKLLGELQLPNKS